MATEAQFVRKYAEATDRKRINMIVRNYSHFAQIIDSKINGMVFLIVEEKAFQRSQSRGDLGVRVQSSTLGDTTCNEATSKVEIKKAIENCSFPEGMLEDIDFEEEIVQDAWTIRCMRRDYELFNSMLDILDPQELEVFMAFLKKEKSIDQLAEECGILYNSADKRLNRLKERVIAEMMTYRRRAA